MSEPHALPPEFANRYDLIYDGYTVDQDGYHLTFRDRIYRRCVVVLHLATWNDDQWEWVVRRPQHSRSSYPMPPTPSPMPYATCLAGERPSSAN
jgi:hypothetical protein